MSTDKIERIPLSRLKTVSSRVVPPEFYAKCRNMKQGDPAIVFPGSRQLKGEDRRRVLQALRSTLYHYDPSRQVRQQNDGAIVVLYSPGAKAGAKPRRKPSARPSGAKKSASPAPATKKARRRRTVSGLSSLKAVAATSPSKTA